MSVYVSLQNALEQSRFREVVSSVISTFEKEPLNASEIIQLGELALQAIDRDTSNKKFKIKILKKLASAYIATQQFAQAKDTYKKLIASNGGWDDFYGLLKALAKIGEIEEIKTQVLLALPPLLKEKKTPQLKLILTLLEDLGALDVLSEEIRFNISCFEGNVEKIVNSSLVRDLLPDEVIKGADWERRAEFAGKVALIAMEKSPSLQREIIKKLYDSFMLQGPQSDLLVCLLKYFEVYNSNHVGYFYNQNPGVRVEMPQDDWIDGVFKKTLKLKKPEDIDVELDLGEDLFTQKKSNEDSAFSKIKILENRISFLLKNNARDEAKKLHHNLIDLDPSNVTFQKEFELITVKGSSENNKDNWKEAWDTLREIEARSNSVDQSTDSLKVSWRNIQKEDLLENYREYAYALIHSGDDSSCLELLEKVLSLAPESFKDASYLKARCCLHLGRNRQARSVAESVIESCILEEHELLELQYLCAESYEAQEDSKNALKIYKKIYKSNPKYRLVATKINSLELK